MNRILFWLIFFLGFNIFVVGPSLFIFWYNEDGPLVYDQRTILTPTVPPGGKLKIRISAQVIKKNCVGTAKRTIVDSSGARTDFEEIPRPNEPDLNVTIMVPLGAAPGRAIYLAQTIWRCNPVQEWFPKVYSQPGLEFEIVPSDDQLQLPEKQGIWVTRPGAALAVANDERPK